MRLTRSWIPAVAAATIGCASPAMPPGGPPDVEAPRLVGIAPDSGRAGVSPRSVVFRFDEVVSEAPPGVTTLANLFVVSPRHGTPVVSWRRNEISVRPRRGWQPNTVYSVTMLPGLADLRGNVRREGAGTLFSTGPAFPATAITGVLYDWAAGTPVGAGLVLAMTTDSTTYLAYSDSAGAFTLSHLPPGAYEVTGVVDGNRNRSLDPREAWDTATVMLADSARVELYAFVHDSVGPRIQEVSAADSVTLIVTFDAPVDARVTPSTGWIAALGPDSISLPVSGLAPPPAAPTDTAAAPRERLPAMPRTLPYSRVIVTLAVPLRPGVTYTVVANGFPGLLGRVATSSRVITIPAPAPVPPATPP